MVGASNEGKGKLTSKQTFDLDAGDYLLNFDLAGSHWWTSQEEVTVEGNNGTLFSEIYSLSYDTDFTTFTIPFSLASATGVSLSFEGGLHGLTRFFK